MTKPKLLHLSIECIEALSIRALKHKPKMDFKNYVQDFLEKEVGTFKVKKIKKSKKK